MELTLSALNLFLSGGQCTTNERSLTVRKLTTCHNRTYSLNCCSSGAFATSPTWHESTRLLLAWNIGTWLYIALTVRALAKANEASIRRHALMGDESRLVVLAFCLVAAVASLAAIVAQLGSVKETHGLLRTGHLGLAVGTIVSAFVFIHLVFAQHYAREFDPALVRGRPPGGGSGRPAVSLHAETYLQG